ncbi:MAG: GGDEF domain-containing protein [Ruminiclostridium sp.]|nr:GGDEF domain-containing protein [Ruminiclostridium sp.]
MNKFSSFFSEKFDNLKSVITARQEHDAENSDRHGYRLLIEHLELKNGGRIVIFSVVTFILGLLEILLGGHQVIGVTGAVILVIGSAILCWLCAKTILDNTTDTRLMKLFINVYWIMFAICEIIISVSEQLEGKIPYSFLIFIAAFISVPVVKLYESAFFAAVTLIYLVSYGIGNGMGVMYYIGAVALAVAYVWIAAAVRAYYSSIWLTERQLDLTEERCTQISCQDTLTGLLNKAGLSAKFTELSSSGQKEKICVVLIDIDNFRAYNHLYGYDKSDDCLYKLCNCIKIVAKPYTELISRFGGDKFVLVLENMNAVEAVKIAEQVRQSIETMAQPFGKGIVTVSIGVSGDAELKSKNTYSDLLNEADNQLIIAKKSGRNCIGFGGRPFIRDGRADPSAI